MQWLDSVAGPGYAAALLWTFAALILLVIVLVIIRLVRNLTFGTFVAGGRNRKTRLAVMDATAVDSHRRLVLVRRDDIEHLLLIGGPTDVVVERDIRLAAPRRPALTGDGGLQPVPATRPRRQNAAASAGSRTGTTGTAAGRGGGACPPAPGSATTSACARTETGGANLSVDQRHAAACLRLRQRQCHQARATAAAKAGEHRRRADEGPGGFARPAALRRPGRQTGSQGAAVARR